MTMWIDGVGSLISSAVDPCVLTPLVTHRLVLLSQGASRTAEDGDRERRTGDERDERIGGAPRGSASRGLPSGPNPGAANRVRNGPEQALSNPASRVQQSGGFNPLKPTWIPGSVAVCA